MIVSGFQKRKPSKPFKAYAQNLAQDHSPQILLAKASIKGIPNGKTDSLLVERSSKVILQSIWTQEGLINWYYFVVNLSQQDHPLNFHNYVYLCFKETVKLNST